MTLLSIAAVSLGTLTQDTAMTPVTPTITGGTSPYFVSIGAPSPGTSEWSNLSFTYPGKLPLGLSLNSSTGAISGTPLAVGDYFFVLMVEDSAGAVVYAVVTGTVGASAALPPNNSDPVGGNMETVTVHEDLSGNTNTGRLTVEGSGFGTSYLGGSTTYIPDFEYKYLKRNNVVN